MTNTTATATNTAANTDTVEIDATKVNRAATSFAKAWERSASSIHSTAQSARTLRESGLKGSDIVDTLKAAIAQNHAAELNISDATRIADMAQAVKISGPAISQLATALTRAEQSGLTGQNVKTGTALFYRAALAYVKSADLNEIANAASELTGANAGILEFVQANIAEQRELAGAAKRRATAEKTDTDNAVSNETAAEVEQSLKTTKNGAAAFTLAEFLTAAETVASGENDNGKKMIRAVAQQIVAQLAGE